MKDTRTDEEKFNNAIDSLEFELSMWMPDGENRCKTLARVYGIINLARRIELQNTNKYIAKRAVSVFHEHIEANR